MRVTDTDRPIVVEPAEEQNKRSAHYGRGWFTKYVTLWVGWREGRGLIHVLRVTHRQMGGGGEMVSAT